MSVSRRQFLTSLGMGGYALLRSGTAASAAAAFPVPRRKGPVPKLFAPIKPSTEDRLLVPEGYRADVVIAWDEPLGTKGPLGPERFGFNNDFNCFFPLDGLTAGKNQDEGILWTNHEYPSPLWVSQHDDGETPKTAEQIRLEKLSVGGSLVQIKRTDGRWKHVPGSKFARRITALYPKIPLTGPAAELVEFGIGTLGNCSGGRSPWLTVLTCEENFPDFNEQERGWRWSDAKEEAIDENQYGWVVEIDPYGELPPQKHSSLGRFKHENVTLRTGPTGRLVAYMGDDEQDQFLYKFVSAAPLDPNASRAEQRKVLQTGTLYAADFLNGKWLPLDLKRSKELRRAFKTQGQVLLHTRAAAKLLKATPVDRCEDCELHPLDGSLYVSMTNNLKHGNVYGHIVRLVETDDNPEAETFRYEIFLAGGPQTGLACPDNLAFDKDGNLWVVCDMASDKINRGAYKPFGNNGLFMVPTRGESAGDAFQFASGPVECEITGPWFTEDGTTLFVSVQHPGEESPSRDKPTSHWPHGGNEIPRPAVVAITGFPK